MGPLPPCIHTFPHSEHPEHSDTFVAMGEPTLAHHYHPKSIVYIRGSSWCLDKCTVTLLYHTEEFHGPTIPLCSWYSPLPLSFPWKPLIFSLFCGLVFFRMPCIWNYTPWSLLTLACFL